MKKTNNSLINKLIAEIAPLNNQYRYAIKMGRNGAEILEIMWDIGEILKKNDIKQVHPIAWKIYGKAEGVKKSNITRDFLSYCFRIRRLFSKKDQIKKDFPNLKKYSLFREAFPLLENRKFKLEGNKLASLKKILNSTDDITVVKKIIIRLKKEKIGISNPRTQRLKEFKEKVQTFFQIYAELRNAIKDRDNKAITELRSFLSEKDAQKLSSLIVSLTREGLRFQKYDIPTRIPSEWKKLWQDINSLIAKSIEDRNRFRRLVPPSYLMRIAEMVNALHDEEELQRMNELITASS